LIEINITTGLMSQVIDLPDEQTDDRIKAVQFDLLINRLITKHISD